MLNDGYEFRQNTRNALEAVWEQTVQSEKEVIVTCSLVHVAAMEKQYLYFSSFFFLNYLLQVYNENGVDLHGTWGRADV